MNRYILLTDSDDPVNCEYQSIDEKEFKNVDDAIDYFQESFTNNGSNLIVKVVALTHNELGKISDAD